MSTVANIIIIILSACIMTGCHKHLESDPEGVLTNVYSSYGFKRCDKTIPQDECQEKLKEAEELQEIRRMYPTKTETEVKALREKAIAEERAREEELERSLMVKQEEKERTDKEIKRQEEVRQALNNISDADISLMAEKNHIATIYIIRANGDVSYSGVYLDSIKPINGSFGGVLLEAILVNTPAPGFIENENKKRELRVGPWLSRCLVNCQTGEMYDGFSGRLFKVPKVNPYSGKITYNYMTLMTVCLYGQKFL